MGRRRLKAQHQMGVAARVALGQLTPEEGEHFRLLYAKCYTPDDFEQVRGALESYCGRTVPTRFTRMLDDDFLGDEA